MQVRVSRHIAAPIDVTFNVFSDVTQIAERIQGINKVDILSEVTHGGGTRWRETRVMFGREATEEMEISAYTPSQSYEVVASSHGMDYHTIYTFTEQDGGTHVEMVFIGTPITLAARLMSPLASLMQGSTQKALEADMDDLKRVCERLATP